MGRDQNLPKPARACESGFITYTPQITRLVPHTLSLPRFDPRSQLQYDCRPEGFESIHERPSMSA